MYFVDSMPDTLLDAFGMFYLFLLRNLKVCIIIPLLQMIKLRPRKIKFAQIHPLRNGRATMET